MGLLWSTPENVSKAHSRQLELFLFTVYFSLRWTRALYTPKKTELTFAGILLTALLLLPTCDTAGCVSLGLFGLVALHHGNPLTRGGVPTSDLELPDVAAVLGASTVALSVFLSGPFSHLRACAAAGCGSVPPPPHAALRAALFVGGVLTLRRAATLQRPRTALLRDMAYLCGALQVLAALAQLGLDFQFSNHARVLA